MFTGKQLLKKLKDAAEVSPVAQGGRTLHQVTTSCYGENSWATLRTRRVSSNSWFISGSSLPGLKLPGCCEARGQVPECHLWRGLLTAHQGSLAWDPSTEANARGSWHAPASACHRASESGYRSIVITSEDTDVMILRLSFSKMSCPLYQKCGTQSRTQHIDIGKLTSSLGRWHVSGCHWTACFLWLWHG